jgi:malate/lactate dehydrogenase
VKNILDEEHRLHLTVLFGLPVQAEKNGINDSYEYSVNEQYKRMKEIVKTNKNHPALLACGHWE